MHGAETKILAMRDGVRPATDICLSEAGGPFPVLLERTPYGRHLPGRSEITALDTNPARRAAIAAFFGDAGDAVVYRDAAVAMARKGASQSISAKRRRVSTPPQG